MKGKLYKRVPKEDFALGEDYLWRGFDIATDCVFIDAPDAEAKVRAWEQIEPHLAATLNAIEVYRVHLARNDYSLPPILVKVRSMFEDALAKALRGQDAAGRAVEEGDDA